MKNKINSLLLTGYKVMLEKHLKKPGFTNSACELLTKNKTRIQKLLETGDFRYAIGMN